MVGTDLRARAMELGVCYTYLWHLEYCRWNEFHMQKFNSYTLYGQCHLWKLSPGVGRGEGAGDMALYVLHLNIYKYSYVCEELKAVVYSQIVQVVVARCCQSCYDVPCLSASV